MPDNSHKAHEASRHVGAAELTPRPTVAANVIRINDSAVAVKAPTTIGVHCKFQAAFKGASRLATATGVTPIGAASMLIASPPQCRPKNDRIAMTMTIRPTR